MKNRKTLGDAGAPSLAGPYADRAAFQKRSVRMLDTSLPMEQRVAAQREDRAYMAGLGGAAAGRRHRRTA